MFSQRSFPALLGGVIIVLLLAGFWTIKISGAETGSNWLAPASLSLQKQVDLSSEPRSINGNIDCFAQPDGSCAVMTNYGVANTNAAVSLDGSSDYRPVIGNIDNRQHFIPIPDSNEFITYTTDPAIGSYLYFNYSFISSVQPKDEALGHYFQVVKSPDGVLTDKAGNKLVADDGSMSFSENSGWMVVSEPNVAMLRVNLQTLEVLPFAQGFDYSIGLSPDVKTAITSDGRYAAVASKNYNFFRLYDLKTCAQVPASITRPVNCQYRDLQNYMQQSLNAFDGLNGLRFINDGAISFYASYDDGAGPKIAKYTLASSSLINQQDYLALGDSYISGEGAYRYLPGTDTADNQCHVSQASYPLLAGLSLNYNAYHSVACSGAQTKDIADTSSKYQGQARPFNTRQELEDNGSISGFLANFQPGYIDQLDFVRQYQPKIVTVSVGGNDIGFSDRLRQCLGLDTCYKTYEDRLEFVRQVNQALPKLINTYTKIKDQGAANARIYVIGYPQIAKADGDCAVNVHMNHDELAFAQQAIDYIDTVVKTAADRTGVFYVDTQDAFYGHRLCEAEAGSAAVNGITAGNDFPDILGGPIGRESYHPNQLGHLLFENKVLETTDNLTSSMPVASSSANLPPENGLPILNAPQSGRTVNQIEYDSDLAPDSAYKGTPVDINLDDSSHAIGPFTSLTAEIHSVPFQLGGFTTDVNGGLKTKIVIPADVPVGFHTLHLFSTNIAGQPVDIYKDIYVAAGVDDVDGNGVSDNSQKCVGVEPAGRDTDQDGMDDSCDGDISLPPAGLGQPVALSATISSQTPGLVAFTSPNQSSNSTVSGVNFIARANDTQPKVLSASTGSTNKIKQADYNLRISPKLILYGVGFLLATSFALSLV